MASETKMLTVRVSPWLYDQLAAAALRDNCSRGRWVKMAIKRLLASRERVAERAPTWGRTKSRRRQR
jgi:hypothetical protein